jgi:hypothetical protein
MTRARENQDKPRLPRSMRTRDPVRVEQMVAEIVSLDLAGARTRWLELMGKGAPPGLKRDFLVRYMAYRIQEEAFGGLDRATIRILERVAAGDESVLDADRRPRFKPGAVLVREWQGKLHHIMVLKEGYSWNGQTFASLSATAFAITGTRWNGYRFFGLKGGSKATEERDGSAA